MLPSSFWTLFSISSFEKNKLQQTIRNNRDIGTLFRRVHSLQRKTKIQNIIDLFIAFHVWGQINHKWYFVIRKINPIYLACNTMKRVHLLQTFNVLIIIFIGQSFKLEKARFSIIYFFHRTAASQVYNGTILEI